MVTADGTRLVADMWGPASDPAPIICLPGLTRNARDFTALCAALDRAFYGARRIIALESRGRGRSGRADPATYTPQQEVADLLEAMAAWSIAKADIVGTSRGGLLAMGLALAAPDRLGRVVLNDIGPFIDPAGLGRIARAVGTTMEYGSFEAFAAELRGALGSQFTALTDGEWVRLARQLASRGREGDGEGEGVRLDYDPALAQTFATNPTGALPDLWPAFDAMADRRPVLVLRGVNSDILAAATVEAMVRRPTVEARTVAEEGHAPLLWDRLTQDIIAAFLKPGSAG